MNQDTRTHSVMTVKDVMTTRQVVSVKPDDDVAVAARLMKWAGVRHLPVVEGQAVVGVFTERDYLRYRAETGGEGGLDPVKRFMTSPAETISPDDPAAAASALMLSRRLGCLPVIAEGELVGIVSVNDLLAADVRAAAPRLELDSPIARVMSPNPVAVQPNQRLLEAVTLMAERGLRCLPVADQEGRLLGMVSDREVRAVVGDPAKALRRALADRDELLVSTVMTSPAASVPEDAPLSDVAARLAREPIGALPVIDRMGRVAGMVSYVDIVRALLEVRASRPAENRAADIAP
jgi:CBS domain-containing protein